MNDPGMRERLLRFRTVLEAVNGEVHETGTAEWPMLLLALLEKAGVERLAVGSGDEPAGTLRRAWAMAPDAPALVPYEQEVEAWKDHLFAIPAGITSTLGGIAATGSLILRPDRNEPRLLSLVPPIHVALLRAAELHATLADAMQAGNWAAHMPTNLLLVSGPSKTADIEQTLVYGVHGPKRLIVLVLLD